MAMFNALSDDGKFQSYHIHGSGHCLVGAIHTIHSFYMATTIDCDIQGCIQDFYNGVSITNYETKGLYWY